MKIYAIDVYYAKNHLISPWTTAYGGDHPDTDILRERTLESAQIE